jgi:hypothetical protein
VAATGVPQARDDHAVAMVRFANAILLRANALAKALESTLGPGTGDLTMRVGKCFFSGEIVEQTIYCESHVDDFLQVFTVVL